MKCSESWLREWVNPTLSREKLCDVLTMAGLEVDELAPIASDFSGIVVGQIVKVEKHPEADKLRLCDVNVGSANLLSIVCGADNARIGIKVPVAMLKAVLPDKTVIAPATIRGIASEGMLCSASELGLSDDNSGLFELPSDAPVGEDLRKYLQLDDYVIDISITPNRGDCLSIRGVAREISALTQSPLLKKTEVSQVETHSNVIHSIAVQAKAACPVYVGRVIRNVKVDAATPVWMRERLRRSGIRSINPIVDVTNYVMLEMGQPMHAFDLDKINQGIAVRSSKNGEKIALLDGTEKQLDGETLVIADYNKPLAIAGVMGGLESSVTLLTKDVFLESAFFNPQVVARQRQYYGLNSDSAYRFERGVDPTIQRDAIERATQLILDISGGEVGPVVELIDPTHMPKDRLISVSSAKIAKILGVTISDAEIAGIFTALKFAHKQVDGLWIVKAPPYRSDIAIAEDLIEEIARLYGYDKIPTHELKGVLQVAHAHHGARDLQPLRQLLCDLGYHEIISYSFIDKETQHLLDPQETPCPLVNPMTAEMTVMRTNLWPGLVNTLRYNQSRQQHRVRFFELGVCFRQEGKTLTQLPRLGGLITGQQYPEQWGSQSRDVDFYDIKGDVDQILRFSIGGADIIYKPDSHPALHPGQTAAIFVNNQKIGLLGALHPSLHQELDIPGKVFLYDLDLNLLQKSGTQRFVEVSRFPEIRRDIAILVNQAIPSSEIQDTIKVIAGDWLKDVFIFDVYQGKGISPGLKSIALALVLQHPTRTLVDDEVATLMDSVTATLKGKLGAELRR